MQKLNTDGDCERHQVTYIPYPFVYKYNHGAQFFNIGFWVRFNSKNPSKRGLFAPKKGVQFKKNPKNRTFEKAEVVFKTGAV